MSAPKRTSNPTANAFVGDGGRQRATPGSAEPILDNYPIDREQECPGFLNRGTVARYKYCWHPDRSGAKGKERNLPVLNAIDRVAMLCGFDGVLRERA